MTQQTHNTVFISYRRSVSAYIARAIYYDLKQNGYDVFMDVESIDSGQFDTIILRQIEARAHFLIICTPGTFERVTESGDWLRREIEYALDNGRNIVPIITADFKFAKETNALLTGKLADLPRYNAVNAPHDYFEEAMTRLRTRFLKLPVGVSITPTPAIDRSAVAAKQAQVESQPKPTVKELSAEEYITRGIANYDKADYDAAIADYSEAIRLNPQYATAYNNRGLARQAKGDLDGALADYNEAIRLNPQYANAYNNRGLARQAKSDLDDAIADYNEAIRLNPQFANAYNNRGNARYDKGDLDGALADYNEAIRLNPQFANAYNNRGNARQAKGDLDGALADYNEAIRLNPQYANAYYNRANTWEKKQNFAEAVDDLQRYLDLGGGKQNGNQAAVEARIRELKAKLGRK